MIIYIHCRRITPTTLSRNQKNCPWSPLSFLEGSFLIQRGDLRLRMGNDNPKFSPQLPRTCDCKFKGPLALHFISSLRYKCTSSDSVSLSPESDGASESRSSVLPCWRLLWLLRGKEGSENWPENRFRPTIFWPKQLSTPLKKFYSLPDCVLEDVMKTKVSIQTIISL